MNKYDYGITPFTSSNYVYTDKDKNITDYIRYMLVRSTAMFQYHNLPETISKQNIELMLQTNGFCAFAKVDENLYIFNGGLGGVPNAYNEPTEINISNPALKFNKTLTIDVDCVIMQNDTLSIGLLPIYGRYCTMLAENDVTMILATVNKRIQNLISANDDNTAESAKQFLKQVFEGKLGIITETKLFESLKLQNGNNSNVVSMQELWEFQQFTKASMYNEIGLNANTNMKRERLVKTEVSVNEEYLYPLVDIMLECRREALEKVNAMFGTDIKVEFNSSWDYRLFGGEPIETQQNIANMEQLGITEETNIEPIDETNLEPKDETIIEPIEETKDETIIEPKEETNIEPKEEEKERGVDDENKDD